MDPILFVETLRAGTMLQGVWTLEAVVCLLVLGWLASAVGCIVAALVSAPSWRDWVQSGVEQ